MKLGVSLRSVQPGARGSAIAAHQQVAEFVAFGRAARDADVDLVLLGERHAVPVNAYSPLPLIARLSAETGRVPLGCLLLAPFHHPILLAEQIATIAALSPVPFTAAFAIGDSEAQFAAYSMTLKSRTVRTDEVVEIVRGLLDGETVTFDGRYHRVPGVAIGPRPDPPVRLWIGGRRGAAVERAGRLGDAWISDTRTPDDELANELERYKEAAARAGRPVYAVVRRNVFVGETDAASEAVVSRALDDTTSGLTAGQVVFGGADRVTRALRRYEAMGFDMAILRHVTADHRLTLDSLGRIGTHVLPLLRSSHAG